MTPVGGKHVLCSWFLEFVIYLCVYFPPKHKYLDIFYLPNDHFNFFFNLAELLYIPIAPWYGRLRGNLWLKMFLKTVRVI